jgi:hypothetical protein
VSKLRYNKSERLRKKAAEQLLADLAATRADKATALRTLDRLESAARRRSDRPEPAPPAPPEPTIDELVSAIEKAEKQPSQVQQKKGTEKAPFATLTDAAPSTPSVTPEYLPTPESAVIDSQPADPAPADPQTAFCAFCQAGGNWNTRHPVGQADGVLLCPPCFSKMCSADMRKATAQAAARSWLYETGTDPNTANLGAMRGGPSRDYENSVRIWEQQAADDTARQEQEARERAHLEAQYNRQEADRLSGGGWRWVQP